MLITDRALPSPDAAVVDQDEGKIFLAARRSPAARRTFAGFRVVQSLSISAFEIRTLRV